MSGGKTRLGVVFGGRSAEHNVSIVSAMDVLREADPARFDVVPFGVTREGRWLTPQESQTQLADEQALFSKEMRGDVPSLLERHEVLEELRGVDVVFPLVHGVNGEDGTLQGMLEMFGIAYAGCSVTASAVGMDKALQKQIFAQAGLNVASHMTLLERDWDGERESITRGIEGTLGYPAFVKPSNGGSSLGVSKVRSREDLGEAMRAAFEMDRKVLVEEALKGHEVDCGVLGSDEPEASPVGEVLHGADFYDYNAKYLDEDARIEAPAKISDRATAAVQEHAVRAYRALDCTGFARVDFFVGEDDTPVINEINTLPGFRPVSMFPTLWRVAGVTYRELISRIVDLGLERFARERARVTRAVQGGAHA